MCLFTDSSIKPSKVNSDGFCLGWKVLSKDNSAPYLGYYRYKRGINFSSKKTVYASDRSESRIYEGFHLFTNREDAREELKEWNENEKLKKLIKVYYKPEDVIAYGSYDNRKAVVVTKLTVKSLSSAN